VALNFQDDTSALTETPSTAPEGER
jgi:hypothetical protein